MAMLLFCMRTVKNVLHEPNYIILKRSRLVIHFVCFYSKTKEIFVVKKRRFKETWFCDPQEIVKLNYEFNSIYIF